MNGLIYLFILTFAIGSVTCVQEAGNVNPGARDGNFVILIDAGSSGSRIHVFHYENGRQIPVIGDSETMKVRPGLSSYAKNPESAGESLGELMVFGKQFIPDSQWSSTPVLLQATAGLRIIKPEEAEKILLDVREFLLMSGFLFRPEWAEIITGKQEGINGWLSTNYMLGGFSQEQATTVGVLEMGGASMQLTYQPKKNIDLSSERVDSRNLATVHIGSKTFNIYTHSYLNFGLEAVQRKFSYEFIDRIEEDGNPCIPRNIKHSGAGDYQQCFDLMDDVMEITDPCPFAHCSFDGVYQPPITDEPFYAIENFFYTTKFFGINEDRNFVQELKQKGQEYCAADGASLLSTYPEEGKENLSKYCFAAAYMPVAIEQAFRFVNPAATLTVKKQVNGKDIDWALGAVLYFLTHNRDGTPRSAGALDHSNSQDYTTGQNSEGYGGTFLILLILAALIIAYFYGQRKKPTAAARPYQTVNNGNMV